LEENKKQFEELTLQEEEQEKQIVDLNEKILFLSNQSIASLDSFGIGETRKEIIDLRDQITEQTTKLLDWSESQEGREEKIVSLVKSASPSVVSIIVNDFSEVTEELLMDNLYKYEEARGMNFDRLNLDEIFHAKNKRVVFGTSVENNRRSY